MNLGTRIALIASTAVAVAVVAIAASVYLTAQSRLLAEVDESLTDRSTAVRAVGDLVAEFGNNRFRGGGPLRDPRGFDALYVQLTSPAGDTTVPEGQPIVLPDPPGGGIEGEVRFTEATIDDIHVRIANVSLGDNLGTLQLARSLEEVDATLASLSLTLLLTGALGVAGAALLGLFVARSSLRPIGELTDAAEKVAETKELAQRIDVDRSDELGRLAEAFNEMMDALEGSREQQRRLVRDAGHELRTPLTALRTNIELLAKADRLPDHERDAIHNDLNTELAELTDLVNEVVEAATEAEVSEAESTVDLGELVSAVVARFRRRANQEIDLHVDEPAVVQGRPKRLERAIGNLIDNAIKWSPDASPISVHVAGKRIAVSDVGPGIKPTDRPRVFDRFYRAVEARSQPGSGLGLSIVKQVAESHGGDVFVEDGPAGGATVGFVLGSLPKDLSDSS